MAFLSFLLLSLPYLFNCVRFIGSYFVSVATFFFSLRCCAWFSFAYIQLFSYCASVPHSLLRICFFFFYFQAGMVWCFYSEVCLLLSMLDAEIPAAMFREKGTEETAVTEHKNEKQQKSGQQNMKPTKNGWPEENCVLGKLHTDMRRLLNSSYETVKYAQIWRI